MKTVELFVTLKVPDTTAITALQTLQKLGFKIKELKRANYYKFTIKTDASKFKEDIKKVDIIVNANKHSCSFSMKKINGSSVLVKDSGDSGASLLSTLEHRLGIKGISSIEKGTLWGMDAPKSVAEKAAKELLANEHYQEYKVM
jgi:phosphoribosylformylglycinamidine (FGAM) synthase PurS component